MIGTPRYVFVVLCGEKEPSKKKKKVSESSGPRWIYILSREGPGRVWEVFQSIDFW